MKSSIHTLCNGNLNPKVLQSRQKVMKHFGITTNITEGNMNHHEFMDHILSTVDSDVIIFMDADCVLLTKNSLDYIIEMCSRGYLVGNAQVTNCIKAKHDYYVAPSLLAISRRYYEDIGRPSCGHVSQYGPSDVAQNLTRTAVNKEKRIRMFFPQSFQDVPAGGIWRLSGYGYFGVGTIYDNISYHLFQSRYNRFVSLFEETCDHIVNGRLDLIKRTYNSRSELMGVLPIEDETDPNFRL